MVWKTAWTVRWLARGLLASLVALTLPPLNAGRITYSYDGRGNLKRVCNALPGNGEVTNYSIDPRENRTGYTNTKTDIFLLADTGLSSPDGRFTLRMQSDGNLVLYQNSNGQSLWASNTVGSGATQAYFQSDGNFVLYRPGTSVWQTSTYMYPCSTLAVQNDGNVVIYTPDGQGVWSTGTFGH